MDTEISSQTVTVDGTCLHYLEGGTGDPVLFLHGWPTSSFLWRNVLPYVAKRNRAIAIDLAGFGKSDKPLDASYSFRFHTRLIDGFLDAIGSTPGEGSCEVRTAICISVLNRLHYSDTFTTSRAFEAGENPFRRLSVSTILESSGHMSRCDYGASLSVLRRDSLRHAP